MGRGRWGLFGVVGTGWKGGGGAEWICGEIWEDWIYDATFEVWWIDRNALHWSVLCDHIFQDFLYAVRDNLLFFEMRIAEMMRRLKKRLSSRSFHKHLFVNFSFLSFGSFETMYFSACRTMRLSEFHVQNIENFAYHISVRPFSYRSFNNCRLSLRTLPPRQVCMYLLLWTRPSPQRTRIKILQKDVCGTLRNWTSFSNIASFCAIRISKDKMLSRTAWRKSWNVWSRKILLSCINPSWWWRNSLGRPKACYACVDSQKRTGHSCDDFHKFSAWCNMWFMRYAIFWFVKGFFYGVY